MTRTIAAAVSSVALLGAALPCSVHAQQPPAPANVTVKELGGCSHALPWTKTSEVRAVKREGATLVVSVFANAACGGLRADKPQARASGDAIALSWSWVNPDGAPMAACKCTRHLEFRVDGVPEGDLTVTAEATRE